MKGALVLALVGCAGILQSQDLGALTELLELDTQYCFFQYHSPRAAQLFQANMEKAEHDRVVICHYGASHIQSEVVTSRASFLLKEQFGDAGPGFVFPFSAADTYDGVNYRTSHTGKWTVAKSYQLPPKLPLGIRGMTIQTQDTTASVSLRFKRPYDAEVYDVFVFVERNENTPGIEVVMDTVVYRFPSDGMASADSNFIHFVHQGHFSNVGVRWLSDSDHAGGDETLTFYGLSIEQPDVVIIDYGTNNILYSNTVPADMPKFVANAVSTFRAINPNVSIVLTSTQDLYYKGKYIDAAIRFNVVMDSLAAVHDCLYWNFYDLSGGFKRIRDWNEKGYARDDLIHLTQKGYDLKGTLLFNSFVSTLNHIEVNPEQREWSMPVCLYEDRKSTRDIEPSKGGSASNTGKSSQKKNVHTVKSGDTLSAIALKYGTTVSRLMKLNGLRSDRLQIGQKIRTR
jgi:lysophospholipase L1-like esterase